MWNKNKKNILQKKKNDLCNLKFLISNMKTKCVDLFNISKFLLPIISLVVYKVLF